MSPPDASDMMTAPSGDAVDAAGTLPRATKAYAHRDDRFALDKKIYGQFFQLYFQRLMLLLPRLKESVARRWPGGPPHVKILDLKEGEECVVMGTLYKDMKLKPSILDEYVKDAGLGSAETSAAKFVSDDDSLVLEDEGARVRLVGPAAKPPEFVTGVVLAARGRVVANGEFEADEVCYPAPAKQDDPPPAAAAAAAAPSPPPPGAYVALVSGLRAGDAGACDPHALELLIDHLTGNLGGAADQSESAKVARVVVAGGALAAPPTRPEPAAGAASSSKETAARPLRDLDVVLSTLAASVPVDLMPGDGDPTNQALPQQPLRACLFPESNRFAPGTFAASTNPHDFSVGGVDFLGTSGQNVDNLRAYTAIETKGEAGSAEEALDLMELTLRWQHLAPSAPDTLACYPYKDRDPFAMQERTPHVYFAGGQPAFGAKVVDLGAEGGKVLAIAVPSFAETGTIVMVNVDDLSCHPVRFKR